jgi:hypothetical protein
MSLLQSIQERCACGATLELKVADSINAARHPHLRAAILDGTLHRYRCELCGRDLIRERELFYFDFDRRQFLCVYPLAALVDANGKAREASELFERVVRREAPKPVREVADRFLVRVCFGYDELREKLLCDENRLSDLALEHLKLRLMISNKIFAANAIGTLWLTRVGADQLYFYAAPLEQGSLLPPVVVERSIYDDIAAPGDDVLYRARPELASGPHVSLLRLVRWSPVSGS